MKPPSNLPRWITVETDQGPLRALAFGMNRQSRFYMGRLPPELVTDVLARTWGHWGSCAEYLHNTVHTWKSRGFATATSGAGKPWSRTGSDECEPIHRAP